ncbi:MAG: OB-fold nucleic acid binding domain-containing protein [Candidatus Pacearchaeota archaeon]
MTEIIKRAIAYKVRISDILKEKPILDGEKFLYVPFDGKQLIRVNVVANIIDKFESESEEKKYLSFTIDDASSQIRLKIFGNDIEKFKEFSTGDTIVVIGTLRYFNNEIYIIPEIIKKKEPSYLLIRKLELEKTRKIDKKEILDLREKILEMIKNEDDNGGIDLDKIILEIKNDPETINKEIIKLLEEGIIYEPRPGKVRILD